MVFNLLALGVLLVGYLVGRRTVSSRVECVLMPLDDQPPRAADDPLPSARTLERYVGQGLAELDAYLAGQCR